MADAVTAYIALGSNVGDRRATLDETVARLRLQPGVEVARVSSYRETDPVGPIQEQPRFLNGAVAVETSLAPRPLLELLLRIEAEYGRRREGPPGGPRTLDLDLLLYGAEEIDEPGLRVPHPRLHERAFVLEPLAELGWSPPGQSYTGSR